MRGITAACPRPSFEDLDQGQQVGSILASRHRHCAWMRADGLAQIGALLVQIMKNKLARSLARVSSSRECYLRTREG